MGVSARDVLILRIRQIDANHFTLQTAPETPRASGRMSTDRQKPLRVGEVASVVPRLLRAFQPFDPAVRLVPVHTEDDRNLMVTLEAGPKEVDDAALEEQLVPVAELHRSTSTKVVAEAV